MPVSRLTGLTRVLFGIGMAAIAAMPLLTVVDVALRYAVRTPVPGAYELVSFLGGIAMSLALPHLQARNGHVVVDFFLHYVPAGAAGALRILVLALTMGLMGLLAWRLGVNAGRMMQTGQVSDILSIPIWQVQLVMTAGPFFAAIVCLDQFLMLGMRQR